MKYTVQIEINVTREDVVHQHPEIEHDKYIDFEQYIINELGWISDSFSGFTVNSIEVHHDETTDK
jgi:hypothetical protein